jgi:hypothetical protein
MHFYLFLLLFEFFGDGLILLKNNKMLCAKKMAILIWKIQEKIVKIIQQ